MKKIIKNPIINAFLGLIIVSGFIHMIILSIQFVLTGSLDALNYFKILDLDIFFRGIKGTPSLILSWVTQFLIFIGVWYFHSRKLN